MPVPAVQAWSRQSTGTKVTWYCCLFFILLGYYGYRHLRWSSASVWLTCHQLDCHLQLSRAQSWERTVKLDLARRQFTAVYAVKATDEGGFVSANPDLNPGTWIRDPIERKKAQKKRNRELNYKGPDSDGNYLSYALVFQDKGANDNDKNTAAASPAEGEGGMADMSLKKILPFCETTDTPGELRLIVRQFRIAQSKRRVRMMMTKIESYIRKRRQKLVIKETAAPSWQGLCAVIFGLIGFLITLLMGTFFDDDDAFSDAKRRRQSGPGVRRSLNKPRKLDDSVYSQRQTPARYEVSTKPAKPPANHRARQRKTTTKKTTTGSSSATGSSSKASTSRSSTRTKG